MRNLRESSGLLRRRERRLVFCKDFFGDSSEEILPTEYSGKGVNCPGDFFEVLRIFKERFFEAKIDFVGRER